MLVSVCIGSNDLSAAGQFYDKVLASLDMHRTIEIEGEIGYGKRGGITSLWVLTPFDGKPATHGNGTQLIFQAPDPESVDAFYNAAIEMGGTDEGPPGPRSYRKGYYGAYCRDLADNKLHVFYLPE